MPTYLSYSPISPWSIAAIALTVLTIVLLWHYRQKFDAFVKEEMNDLLNSQPHAPTAFITPELLKNLPPIVQKWLTKSGVIGKNRVQTVHLKQSGLMRTKPDEKWMPMKAEQVITVAVPGFIWKGTIDADYFMSIKGRDKYMNGKGNMLIKLSGVFPFANSSGEEIDQSAMMRYLAEIVWVPTTALENFMHWEYVNDTTARAFLTINNRTVSGLFFFSDDGDVMGFEGKRYGEFDGLYSLETWSIRILEHKDFNGMRIGNKCEVKWKLKEGDFTWLTLEVDEMEFKAES